jgi:tetratricopeptide (TPR) repeat protein
MKNILNTICCIGFIIIASSCSKTAEDIPLKNIDEHLKYQAEKIIGREITDSISIDEQHKINTEKVPADLVNEYHQILNKNPKSAEALFLFNYLNYDIKLIDKSLTINPKFYYSIVAKAGYYEAKGDFKKAESTYKKAILINPRHYMAHNNLAHLYAFSLYDDTESDRIKQLEILSKAKSEYIKCPSSWFMSQSIINKSINEVNRVINGIHNLIKLEEERIKLEKKLCSQYEHEEFLRIAFKGLGKSIYQINLMAKNGCSYGWYVLAYNKYGGISTCQIVTTPNYETGEIECKSVSCDD